jgi:predicted NBD/HSP70 family sugar kinase
MMYLVIDIGGTAIKYALMNKDSTIIEQSSTKTPDVDNSTLEEFLIVLENIVKTHLAARPIKGVAISMPGIIDNKTGHAYIGGAITYLAGVNLAKILGEKFQIPVTIENDAKSAALAELWQGNLKNCKNAAVITLGTGVGGGIIINGSLYSGNFFAAGEFSYILVDDDKPEDLKSFLGFRGGVSSLLKLVHEETGIPLEELDGFKVFEMANQGDSRVLVALNQYTKSLTIPIYNLQTVLDLEKIAVGGGISRQPLLITSLQKNLEESYEKNPIHSFAPYVPRPKVVTCKFYNDANLIGALYHHLNMHEGTIQ